jgi:beta-glucosidase
VVLYNGSALSVNWAAKNADAIVDAWYGGEEAGTAIAETLAGANNPAGRLPVTFYTGVKQLPPFENYSMQGRTYRYFKGKPLYPFGYGLSYTTFQYSNLRLSAPALSAHGTVTVSAEVKNIGTRTGDEVVQLYVQVEGSKVERPLKELRGFQRITLLQPGVTQTVEMPLPGDSLAWWNEKTGHYEVEPGRVRVMLGGSSADIRLQTTVLVK